MIKWLCKKGKTKMAKNKILINGGISVAMAVASVVAVAVQINKPATARTAEEIGAEIQQIQTQIDQAQKHASELRAKSDGLKAELDSVASQRTALEGQIKVTKAQYEKLLLEIKETEENIEKNRKTLGSLLAKMSIEDDLSPIERIAGSDNISSALDNFEYQSSAKTKLTERVKLIKKQKKTLEEKRDQVKKTLEDQQKFERELQSKIAEQNRLIQITQGEEAEYNKYAAEKNSQKVKLQEEQRRAFEEAQRRARQATGGSFSLSGSDSGGGYTWGDGCWVGNDLSSHGPNGGVDPLGYGCRQCVSYTAFKALQVHGVKALWWGNANMWPASARSRGFRTGTTPKANSVGVQYIGYYGHVVWVDSVNPNGTVNISQYNYPVNGRWGMYSTMTVSASAFQEYIYFD